MDRIRHTHFFKKKIFNRQGPSHSTQSFPKMIRVDANLFQAPKGVFHCARCVRPFEEDPREVKERESLAKLRALEDDEQAARAFYYHRENTSRMASLTRHFVTRIGLQMPKVGLATIDGIELNLEPDADPKAVVEFIEQHIIPFVRTSIIEEIGGVAKRKCEAFLAEEKRRLEANEPSQKTHALGPYHPYMGKQPIEKLYPYGYTRAGDGTVEPNPEPDIKTSIQPNSPGDAVAD